MRFLQAYGVLCDVFKVTGKLTCCYVRDGSRPVMRRAARQLRFDQLDDLEWAFVEARLRVLEWAVCTRKIWIWTYFTDAAPDCQDKKSLVTKLLRGGIVRIEIRDNDTAMAVALLARYSGTTLTLLDIRFP